MRLDGRVALITGAAKSQGRSHAIRLAREGADIIAVDICRQIGFVPYPMATPDDLAQTVRAVEALDRRIVAAVADVRDAAGLQAAIDDGVGQLGRLDIVSANAAITSVQKYDEVTPEIWNTTLDVNLTGVWNTCAAAIPHLISAGGGSITITTSSAGVRALPFYLPYVAAKHALVGVARALALELADRGIRVNLIAPTGVDTPQGHSAVLPGLLGERPDLRPMFTNTLPVSHIQPSDVSSALLYLCSDDARYVTGACLMVDAGSTIR
jgi:SDR family mycofactocin-dependent oxidoreductase